MVVLTLPHMVVLTLPHMVVLTLPHMVLLTLPHMVVPRLLGSVTRNVIPPLRRCCWCIVPVRQMRVNASASLPPWPASSSSRGRRCSDNDCRGQHTIKKPVIFTRRGHAQKHNTSTCTFIICIGNRVIICIGNYMHQ